MGFWMPIAANTALDKLKRLFRFGEPGAKLRIFIAVFNLHQLFTVPEDRIRQSNHENIL